MALIDTFVEYILPGGSRGKRAVKREDTDSTDLLGYFAPITDELITDIKEVLPAARGVATAANSLSVISAEDRPLEVQEKYSEGNNTLAITTALSNGAFIDVSKFSRFSIQIENSGSTVLNAFEISTKNHSTGDTRVRYSTSGNYSTLDSKGIIQYIGNLGGAFENPTTLAATAKIIIDFDLTKFFVKELRFRASVASGSTTLAYKWGGI